MGVTNLLANLMRAMSLGLENCMCLLKARPEPLVFPCLSFPICNPKALKPVIGRDACRDRVMGAAWMAQLGAGLPGSALDSTLPTGAPTRGAGCTRLC